MHFVALWSWTWIVVSVNVWAPDSAPSLRLTGPRPSSLFGKMIQVVLSDDPPALDDLSVPRVYLYPEEPGDPYTVHSWRDLTGAFTLPPVLLGDDGVEVPTDLLKVAPKGTEYEAGERRAPPLPPHLHEQLRAALDQLKVFHCLPVCLNSYDQLFAT